MRILQHESLQEAHARRRNHLSNDSWWRARKGTRQINEVETTVCLFPTVMLTMLMVIMVVVVLLALLLLLLLLALLLHRIRHQLLERHVVTLLVRIAFGLYGLEETPDRRK